MTTLEKSQAQRSRNFGIPIRRPEILETTALGAARLAGLSAGSPLQIERTFESRISEAERREIETRWADALTRAS